MKQNVMLCDECKKRIAVGKCFNCNKDLCENCSYQLRLHKDLDSVIHIYTSSLHYGDLEREEKKEEMLEQHLLVCRECRRSFYENWKLTNEETKLLLISLLEIFKKYLVISKLNDKKDV